MNILCICHNIPYPPNKGEKIRPYYFIKHLAKEHDIFLLSLSKNYQDCKYEEELKKFCKTCQVFPLSRLGSKVLALLCLLSPFPMTFGYFYSKRLKREIAATLAQNNIDAILAFCSSSAQYVLSLKDHTTIVDLIDVDSEKWRQYQTVSSFPQKFLYRTEHQRLRKWERRIHQDVNLCLLTTDVERERLESIVGEVEKKIEVVPNGVDLNFFKRSNDTSFEKSVVFTGQMDYLPNVDAVIYFYLNILPLIKNKISDTKFYIVGRNPNPELAKICVDAVVTGEVEDIREHLHQARVLVAPLRLAFGVQNKVLEAMASEIPVVATSKVANSLRAVEGRDLLVADDPEEFAEKVVGLIENEERAREIAKNGRAYVEVHHDWQKILNDFEAVFLEQTRSNSAVSDKENQESLRVST